MSKLLRSQWLFGSRQYLGYGLIGMLLTMVIVCFLLILAVSDGQRANNRTIFESYRWNALQLQLQSYRFEQFLLNVQDDDFPLQGAAYDQYDIVMSRIDLLRNNQVGTLFRNYTDARTIRLLNIINGEFELVSLGIERLENNDATAIKRLLTRLERIAPQINEFVVLTHQDANKYANSKRQELKSWLSYIQLLGGIFLVCLILLLLISYRSIRNLKQVNDKCYALESKLQDVLEEKTDTLTMISQEVRAPLNAVLGVSGSLSKGPSAERSKDLGRRLEEYGTQLLGSIEMLQDLALIDVQQLELAPKSGSVRLNIESCLLNSGPQLNRKGLRSVFVVDPSIPETIVADFSRLREIVLALIQNAITFTPSGTVSVILRMSANEPNTVNLSDESSEHVTQMMQIAVRDTGTGLPLAIQKALRNNPLLASHSEKHAAKDMKLGLTLCHKLIYLMGGNLHFSSSSRNGTEFWVDVPIHIKHNTKALFNPLLKDKHVLLVDPDKHLSRTITILLMSYGMHVTHSETAGLLTDEDFDLVLLAQDLAVNNDGVDYLVELYNSGIPIVGDKRYIGERCLSLLSETQIRFPYTHNQTEQELIRLFTEMESNATSESLSKE
ncbi:sensor histidine kinase [Marinomonas balearica]|uniref:histidine kinase n=1 Tax=Marinomonas balearica TaxID=491947 RepID=A0A4R6M928_9GAMM|nr:ATP-binding protein [Marinomonas balearica]TDO97495.1 histidine kinase/DNA gyrase B/HSP90-like ATPase [Marinomonas balearica]